MDISQLKQLFPGLEEELYRELEQTGSVRNFEAGTTLLKSGQPIRSTMLVLSGTVKLYQDDEEGDEFYLYHLQPGQACAVSMLCAFTGEQSKVKAKAVSDVVMLSIPLETMNDWMTRYPAWNHFVVRSYRDRYEELLQTIHGIAFKNMDERLLFYLQKQVAQFGNTLSLTHQDIATDLNSSREVISRLLKKMESKGWLTLNRYTIEWAGNYPGPTGMKK